MTWPQVLTTTIVALLSGCQSGPPDIGDVSAGVDSEPDIGVADAADTEDGIDFCSISLWELWDSPEETHPDYIPTSGTPCDCPGHLFRFRTGEGRRLGTAICGGTENHRWSVSSSDYEQDVAAPVDDAGQ